MCYYSAVLAIRSPDHICGSSCGYTKPQVALRDRHPVSLRVRIVAIATSESKSTVTSPVVLRTGLLVRLARRIVRPLSPGHVPSDLAAYKMCEEALSQVR
jgi:hypothetical protein